MANRLDTISDASSRRLLVDTAKKAAEAEGYKLTRVPGRELSDIWNLERDGKTQAAAIRTTRNRWIIFPPLDQGARKMLDDVELVVVAAVDAKDDPQNIEVYIFPAEDVRQRFVSAYAARVKAGHVVRDDYGVALDNDTRPTAYSVGSGIVDKYHKIASYSIDDPQSAAPDAPHQGVNEIEVEAGEGGPPAAFNTTAEVMAWARHRLAEIAGIRADAVKLELKLEY
jgi:hypothetical protein